MRVLIAYKSSAAYSQQSGPQSGPQSYTGLGVSACSTAKTLRYYGIQAEATAVVDGYDLRDKLNESYYATVTHVVISAPFFDTPYLIQLCGLFPKIRFTITFHSNVGFLGTDPWAIKILSEELTAESTLPNFIVSANSQRMQMAVTAAFKSNCALLPNLYYLQTEPGKRPLWTKSAGPLKIGAFGAIRLFKNLPTAAWAAQIMSQKLSAPVEFWVSSGREEGPGAAIVLAGIKQFFSAFQSISLVENKWQSWTQFRQTVGSMHLTMQPSFTESFNIVTADSIAEGVPAVVGPAIGWAPKAWIADVDDACDVAKVGLRLLQDASAPARGWKALQAHNDTSIAAWRQYLGVKKPAFWPWNR